MSKYYQYYPQGIRNSKVSRIYVFDDPQEADLWFALNEWKFTGILEQPGLMFECMAEIVTIGEALEVLGVESMDKTIEVETEYGIELRRKAVE